MLFLCNVTIPSLEKAKPFLPGHGEFLKQSYESGVLKTYGPYLPLGTGGFAIFEAASQKEIDEILACDPLTQNQACYNEIHEITVTALSADLLK